jgi:hypothetical protein
VIPAKLFLLRRICGGRRRCCVITRRAALLVWLGVMSEAEESGASPDLAAAMCALFFQLNPHLLTNEGGQALRELARSWAAAEAAQ